MIPAGIAAEGKWSEERNTTEAMLRRTRMPIMVNPIVLRISAARVFSSSANTGERAVV
jgi:hypothetical protein